MVLETLMKLCRTELEFLEKAFFSSKNWGNGPKIGKKWSFLNLRKHLVIYFYWICSIMKICIIYCVPAQILYREKSFSWDIGQILSASQIAGFLNQLFLQNKFMKQPHLLSVDKNSQRLKVDQKFVGWSWSKWVWPVWFLDSKIDCIWRMNRWK